MTKTKYQYTLKRKLIIVLMLCFIANYPALFAQNLDNCGIDNSSFLNKDEALLLNDYFKSERGNFDFQNKKVAIIRGSAGSNIGDKQIYFHDIKTWKEKNSARIATWLIILSEEDKLKSGGYDALLTHWVMAHISERKRKKLVKKLSSQ